VLKRKAGGGPHEVDEETVDLLAKGVEELQADSGQQSAISDAEGEEE
jgi:hypothetical protein